MEKEIILDNDVAFLVYYPAEKIVHHKFKSFIYGKDFQDVLMKGADLFEEKGYKKWLSDDSESSALRSEDIEWGNQHWRPRMIGAGWKYWAIVMPKKVVGQMTLRPLIEEYSKLGVTVEVF